MPQVRALGLHVIVDGWTAPAGPAWLSLVIQWYENGHIWRITLEFLQYVNVSVLLAYC